MALLELTDISKSFGGVQALRNVDFTLNAGQIHGLAGENGAGKSTLVKIIGGVHQPNSGSIVKDGEPIALMHNFLPTGLEKFQRRAEDVANLIREAFLRGISTRQVGRTVATFGRAGERTNGFQAGHRVGPGGRAVPHGGTERRMGLSVSGWRVGEAEGSGRDALILRSSECRITQVSERR